MRNLADFSVGSGNAVPIAAQGAADYASAMGLVRPNRFDNVLVNRPQAQRIAADYQAAPSFDRNALPSYDALREETKRQFDFMTRPTRRGGLGIDYEVTKSDPYSTTTPSGREVPDPAGMMQDVRDNNRIKVLSTATTGSHPYMSDDENDMFRGVHDFFGHAATGRGFDAHGEEAAWRSHYSMFSPLARHAMTTETRGQNSVNNYGGLPQGEYAEQKVILLPKSDEFITPFGRRAAFTQAYAEAKRYHDRKFGKPIV